MPITYKTYDVAFLPDDDTTTPVELEGVIVYKSDEVRAELEGRRFGIKGPAGGPNGVTDLGDHVNSEALELWSALVRMGAYAGKSSDFRLKHVMAWDKHKDPRDEHKALQTPVDPTRPDTSGVSDSPAPLSSEDSTTG